MKNLITVALLTLSSMASAKVVSMSCTDMYTMVSNYQKAGDTCQKFTQYQDGVTKINYVCNQNQYVAYYGHPAPGECTAYGTTNVPPYNYIQFAD